MEKVDEIHASKITSWAKTDHYSKGSFHKKYFVGLFRQHTFCRGKSSSITSHCNYTECASNDTNASVCVFIHVNNFQIFF